MNTLIAKEGRLVDGIVRTPGTMYQDIRAEDPNPGPDEIYGDFPQPAMISRYLTVGTFHLNMLH